MVLIRALICSAGDCTLETHTNHKPALPYDAPTPRTGYWTQAAEGDADAHAAAVATIRAQLLSDPLATKYVGRAVGWQQP